MIKITEDNLESYLLQWELDGKLESLLNNMTKGNLSIHAFLLQSHEFNTNIKFESSQQITWKQHEWLDSIPIYSYTIHPKNKITELLFKKLNLSNTTVKKGILNRVRAKLVPYTNIDILTTFLLFILFFSWGISIILWITKLINGG